MVSQKFHGSNINKRPCVALFTQLWEEKKHKNRYGASTYEGASSSDQIVGSRKLYCAVRIFLLIKFSVELNIQTYNQIAIHQNWKFSDSLSACNIYPHRYGYPTTHCLVLISC